jgi:uncharacterized membrane protein YfcA
MIAAALHLVNRALSHARCLPKLNTERKNCTPMTAAAGLRQMIVPTVATGFVVGIAGGLIGLGGAELRLPYLVGVLLLAPRAAVPVNLAVSLLTVLASLPVRLGSVDSAALMPWLPVVLAITPSAPCSPPTSVPAGCAGSRPRRWRGSSVRCWSSSASCC